MINAKYDDEMFAISITERGKSWLARQSIIKSVAVFTLLILPSLLAVADSAMAAKDARSPASSKDMIAYSHKGRFGLWTT